MAIDDDVVALLGECPTDAGGLFRFQVVRGHSGRERVLLTFYPQNNGTPRHLLLQAFVVSPLIRALKEFQLRDPLRPENAGVVPPPPPKPEPKAPPVNPAMADALQAALQRKT